MRGIIFGPDEIDGQEPHIQDEIYIVVRGSGEFELEGEKVVNVGVGDFLFVPANTRHRFRNFSPDLLLWAIFYGEEGGEAE
ncbi:cupin domain-containing protein [Chitinophaga vietnamensis]|uniref:cupin domain-containing protein n=1 Tax=Chitinophaga vietnamensis TaxID=2593957 RepID=UPI001F1B9969|nr:cupin domain-containing protein [Chitinophaga vietnamensis]